MDHTLATTRLNGEARSTFAVEEIVDQLGTRSPNAVVLPNWTVTAIAAVPGGAHPSYAFGYYGRDNSFYIAWDTISRERDSFLEWMNTNVIAGRPEDFSDRVPKRMAEATL